MDMCVFVFFFYFVVFFFFNDPATTEIYTLSLHDALPILDNVARNNLDEVRYRVLEKDFDFLTVIDGREGSGKSVLAMQYGAYLDPNFCLDNIVFTAEDFIKKIKDPKTKKGACVLLDEGFNAINSRASMSEINRSMGAIASEMRQKNLFIIVVLPSFFDLDKQFALHRASSLIHVYLKDNVDRGQYLIFPRSKKLYLYLNGKKTYNYSKPKSPFPDRKSTRLNSSHIPLSRMPSSA